MSDEAWIGLESNNTPSWKDPNIILANYNNLESPPLADYKCVVIKATSPYEWKEKNCNDDKKYICE